jgi:hypothetical protein
MLLAARHSMPSVHTQSFSQIARAGMQFACRHLLQVDAVAPLVGRSIAASQGTTGGVAGASSDASSVAPIAMAASVAGGLIEKGVPLLVELHAKPTAAAVTPTAARAISLFKLRKVKLRRS